MNKLTTLGSIKDGVLHIFYRNQFVENIKNLTNGTYEVIIRKKTSIRSNSQNAYYWGVIINSFINGYKDTVGEDTDAETAHWMLKHECNYTEIVNADTGEVKKIPHSTRRLTKTDFNVYIEKCRSFILEWFGVYVPLPEEQSELNF